MAHMYSYTYFTLEVREHVMSVADVVASEARLAKQWLVAELELEAARHRLSATQHKWTCGCARVEADRTPPRVKSCRAK